MNAQTSTPTPHRMPQEEYTRLLWDYWRHRGEDALVQAADLGKLLVHSGRPLEDIGEFQQHALAALSRELPAMPFDVIAARTTPPLMELLMAYGLAFREHITRYYQHLIEIHLENTSKVLMAHGLTFREQLKQHYDSLVERRLERTSKLESLGTLSSGIAHDFNTLLGVILGYAEMTLEEVPDDSPAQQNLQQIMLATHRARDLVARILTFSRRDESSLVPVRVADSLGQCLVMLRVMLPPSITVHTDIKHAELAVLGDATEWQQLIMDLTMNAVDAMTELGEIHFALDAVTFDEQNPPPPGLTFGQFVSFRIRDTGCGIPAEIAERIFEPFFTTKPVGHGTGLGLSVVYGIVKRMNGTIELKSAPGQGAEFEILCPAYHELDSRGEAR